MSDVTMWHKIGARSGAPIHPYLRDNFHSFRSTCGELSSWVFGICEKYGLELVRVIGCAWVVETTNFGLLWRNSYWTGCVRLIGVEIAAFQQQIVELHMEAALRQLPGLGCKEDFLSPHRPSFWIFYMFSIRVDINKRQALYFQHVAKFEGLNFKFGGTNHDQQWRGWGRWTELVGAHASSMLPNLEALKFELDTSLEVFGVNSKGQGRGRGSITFELHAPTTVMDGVRQCEWSQN